MSGPHSLLLLVAPGGFGGNRSSNPAASASGICAIYGNRQLLTPWIRVFGYLSSFGISNDLDGLLDSTSRSRFQVPPLLAFSAGLLRCRHPSLQSFSAEPIAPILSNGFSRFDLFHRLPLSCSKKASILVLDPPPRALLTKSPAGRYGSFRLFY